MSAQPVANAAPDLVNIEIDGVPVQVAKGSMIIQAADAVGIAIPRFCYHRKLPIAANCRMCLVEIEKMPKPAPACATPVGEGMKVFTRSDKALKSQRNVMEFLLINHPLDCPICDQGGECELQDVSLGYGRSVSRYVERKRTVADENLGPLIATEMTRCIQCTRCVRFTSEIAGTYELGGMSRGENLEIGTYIGKTIESELSGNIIDVCPVGALTNKPFQFQARAWELVARPSVAYHDALGSNLWLHTRRGEVLRTVPRDNESINECWLSDRDRYSHQGLYAADRVKAPMVKRNGQWSTTTWDDALSVAREALKSVSGADLGILVNPATTNEEGELLVRLARGLGSAHVDHRLRQLDFADNAFAKPFASAIASLDKVKSALLVGSDLRYEVPLLNHRIRQAAKKGAKVFAVNPAHFNFNFDLAGEAVAPPHELVAELLQFAKVAAESGAAVPESIAAVVNAATTTDDHRAAYAEFAVDGAVVIFGHAAANHPEASWLRAIARFIAQAAGAAYNEIPAGANAVGLSTIGVLPTAGGLDARAMLAQPRKGYVLYNVEPPYDFADGAQAQQAMHSAQTVVAFAAYASDALKDSADVILPIALTPELEGTLVNAEGTAQAVLAGSKAPGEAREGWKVLRALGGSLGVAGFEFDDLAGLRDGMTERTTDTRAVLGQRASGITLSRVATVPVYRGDAVLRRAGALNSHPLNRAAAIRVSAEDAGKLGLADGGNGRIGDSVLPVVVDAAVPAGAVWIDAALPETAMLPPYGAAITLSKA
ncbi:NADH-quinone oxidoreductase subunit NuoG [Luteibacter aegosomatissinici]|uniref:NADH-quinone oxidoreductase subunit NuoG n=1 Tax=Luteibacter aegosomatissinici TaxID=2911539 RepID=UPI001FFA46B3|nr:NADH-quinone oxidoreductase subunit NuoG [Luteibacter aegosomatissinici]UPG93082.1 NADH-quinone oxidoreductase subunit NuoG [Luteibacter aegosomatissinici]